jgi:CRP-like cAMP-binding protein
VGEPITHSLVKALREVPDFSTLDDAALFALVGASANLFWRAGSQIFSSGTRAEVLYVVLSGRVRIADSDAEDASEVAIIEAGDYFGEQALLLRTSHTRSATALSDSEIMVIPQEAFSAALAANTDLAAHFRRKLETRLLERGEHVRR